jgi:hypothetical protein
MSDMATESVHLTALADSVLGTGGGAPRPTAGEIASLVDRHRSLARLGAVLVDQPYFEALPRSVLRYVTRGRAPAESTWGDRLHAVEPQRLLEALLARVADGRAEDGRGGPGRERLLAVALGLASHLAVDVVTHPVVNRLARARAAALGTTEREQHSHVEKWQALLLHERTLGRRALGAPPMRAHLDVPARAALADDRLARALRDALREAYGAAPPLADLRAWASGYAQYAALLGTPAARLYAPARERDEARALFFDAPSVDYPRTFARACALSTRYVETAYARARGDLDDDALRRAIPRQSIDEPTQHDPTHAPRAR